MRVPVEIAKIDVFAKNIGVSDIKSERPVAAHPPFLAHFQLPAKTRSNGLPVKAIVPVKFILQQKNSARAQSKRPSDKKVVPNAALRRIENNARSQQEIQDNRVAFPLIKFIIIVLGNFSLISLN